MRRINYEKKNLLAKFPELEEQSEFVQSSLEKKYDYKPALPYHQLIRRPLPNELPKKMTERMNSKHNSNDDML